MTDKRRFVDYVKNGGERLLCSPQIGAGAGYDAKLLGRQFCSQAPAEELPAICRRYPMTPLFNVGLDPIGHLKSPRWTPEQRSATDQAIEARWRIDTPHGAMRRHSIEHPKLGGFNVESAVNGVGDLDKLEYLIDRAIDERDCSCHADTGRHYARLFGEQGALSVQWCMQPYEMLGFPDTVTTVLLAMDDEPRFFRLMDKIVTLDKMLIDALAGTGVDFVFLGGPGSEMISPAYYEKYLVPYSQRVTDYAHQKGLLIYSHICSPIEPMLTMGYYNRMGIDLFETLSPKPEGNVSSLRDAFSKLDPAICTRGNVSLSLMVTGRPQEIRDQVFAIMDAAHDMGRKHIVAVSDYLLYDVPEDNVAALCRAAQDYYG
ncbi:MAG: hypothetical protein GX558_02365 [Clostridiales bacterium]|nr:hypothetical protein [Clostridiales bacterium]